MPIRGCMSCSGDTCQKCQFWTPDATSKWGACSFFTDNPGVPRRIYVGNVKGLLPGETVKTTSNAKCRNFERG